MGKKFMGLGGTDHFWDRAKAWILNQITSAVTAKIAEIVANAPEDLDTLKEIADWITEHADDAAAMNTQINTNKSDISALKTSVAGKADKAHTHSAGDITSGTLPIGRGGTGATDAATAFNTLADATRDSSTPEDNEKMLLKPAGTWHKTTCLDFWNYIKGKISSVLGLTANNYGGKASMAESANFLFYTHGSEINFKGGAQGQCWFNYRNADTDGPSPVSIIVYRFCNYSGDTSKSVLMAGSFDGNTAKASSKMVIPIGAPSQLEDGCIWIER